MTGNGSPRSTLPGAIGAEEEEKPVVLALEWTARGGGRKGEGVQCV